MKILDKHKTHTCSFLIANENRDLVANNTFTVTRQRCELNHYVSKIVESYEMTYIFISIGHTKQQYSK